MQEVEVKDRDRAVLRAVASFVLAGRPRSLRGLGKHLAIVPSRVHGTLARLQGLGLLVHDGSHSRPTSAGWTLLGAEADPVACPHCGAVVRHVVAGDVPRPAPSPEQLERLASYLADITYLGTTDRHDVPRVLEILGLPEPTPPTARSGAELARSTLEELLAEADAEAAGAVTPAENPLEGAL